jgi:acyl-CoA-binding protein
MSELRRRFEQAAQEVQSLPRKPDNDTLLRLYALYKQSTVGDVAGNRPGFTDFTGRAKYDAWAKIKGTPSETSMQQYIDLAAQLKEKSV